MIPLVDLKKQYESIKHEIDSAIADVVQSCQFILGEQVERFEADFAAYCQTRFAFGVNSGTSAVHLALLAAGVGPGDEVITRRTRVIMPVHLYGSCAEMDPISNIAHRHNLIVIEDAAQAHGAEYKGQRAGSMGDLACFSFYPGKNLGAYGEAGAVVTNNEKYVDVIKQLRDQGQSEKYYHARVGYNYRMEAIQGAVLGVKLKHLDDWNRARREHQEVYRRELSDVGLRLLKEPSGGKSVHHIFPLFSERRDELRAHLHAAGISTGVHYPIPVHLQRGYRMLGYNAGDLPHTERACREVLSLPLYAELTNETVMQIAGLVRQFCQQAVAVVP